MKYLSKKLIVLFLLLISSTLWYLFGGPFIVLFVLAISPWFLLINRYLPRLFTLFFLFLLTTILLIWVLLFSGTMGFELPLSIAAAMLLIGISGLLFTHDSLQLPTRPKKETLGTYFYIAGGSILWFFTLGISSIIPRSSKLGWVMLGDSANNLLMARDVVYSGGILLGQDANPAPLPSALIAIWLAPSRSNLLVDSSLELDVQALAFLWALIIGVSCFLSGYLTFLLASKFSSLILRVRILSFLGSLAPLSWFVSGYPIDFGFFNSQIALLLMLTSIVLFFSYTDKIWLTLLLQPLIGTLLAATWAPLVLLPFSLFLVSFIYWGRQGWPHGKVLVLPLIGSIIQFVAYALVFVLPMFIALSGAVSVQGGAYNFNPLILVVLAILVATFGFLLWKKSLDIHFVGVVSISVSFLVGMAFLLYLNKSQENLWTYYPLKYLWTGSTVLFLLLISLCAALLVKNFIRQRFFFVMTSLSLIASIFFLNWSPITPSGYIWRDPLLKIVAGSYMGKGDSTAKTIFDASKDGKTNFFWKSNVQDEAAINFWLLQDAANSIKPNVHDIRLFAYGIYDQENETSVCDLAELLEKKLVVISTSRTLISSLQDNCPELGIEVKILG